MAALLGIHATGGNPPFPEPAVGVQYYLSRTPWAWSQRPVEILIPADRIRERVAELARQIAADFAGRPVTIIGVLTGSLIFLADLVRHVDLQVKIGLIQASSYRGATTVPAQLQVQAELVPDVRGRHVLLLDDILDTGRTLSHLVGHLAGLEVASLRVTVLLRKKGRQQLPVEPDYCGFEIPNVFVVGYGLDFNDEFRQLPYIAILSADAEGPPV